MARKVTEAGQGAAGGEKFGEQMPLRQREQMAVGSGQPPVVDVQQDAPAVQQPEAGQAPGPALPCGREHAELVEHPLASGLEDLPVEVAPRGGGAPEGLLDQRDAYAGAQQHQAERQPRGSGPDHGDIRVHGVRGAGAGGAPRAAVRPRRGRRPGHG
ncbi:hypothetical protein GA0115238_12623 [Streptomyces sp. di50b]|nr:hypothetical protein GA0115238_12623 [Streptomyces sp. di50b]